MLAATRIYDRAEIAASLGIAMRSLERLYARELNWTNPKVDAQVMLAIIYHAGGNGDPKNADPATTRWYGTNRLGFKERREVKHSGAIGSIDLSKLSDEELDIYEALSNRVSVAGDVPSGES